MAKFELKSKALMLRQSGCSLKEISLRCSISKSTASLWCSGVVLSRSAIKRLEKLNQDGRLRGRLLGSQKNHEARLHRVILEETAASLMLGDITSRDRLLSGISLYWGEGSKGRKFSFANSDLKALKFFIQWLCESMDVEASRLVIYVFINKAHQHRINEILQYWSNNLSVPMHQFANPTLLNVESRKVYENEKTYYGVVSIRVKKSTLLQYRVLGLIKALQNAGVAQVVRAQHS